MHLSKFGRSRIANRDLQDEFIQFCALQLLEHKKYARPSEYIFIDFLRQYFGRNNNKMFEQLNTVDFSPVTESFENQSLFKLSAKPVIDEIFKRIPEKDKKFLKAVFYSDLTGRKLAKIFKITPSGVTHKTNRILNKIKCNKFLMRKISGIV